MAPSGDLYVSDGYGNARIHIFGTDGTLKSSFGGPAGGPGQFMLPHSVWVHTDGRVFVTDRENDRIQIFDAQGNLLDAWTNVTRPGDLYIDAQDNVYVGEMYWVPGMQSIAGQVWQEDRPSRLTVRTLSGEIVSRFGGEIGSDPCAAAQLHVAARHLGRQPRRRLRRRGQQNVLPGHDLPPGVPLAAEVRPGEVTTSASRAKSAP